MSRIRPWALAGALAIAVTAAVAQEESLEAKRDQKLAEPYMKAAPWITDYDQARAEAKKTGKLIFAYFNRSYAY